MSLLESIVLGIVQGLTEFIPVSSSGHLELVPKFFNWSEPSTGFITFLHFGTLLALVIYYRTKLYKCAKSLFYYLKNKDKKENDDIRIIRNVVIATIPAGILGFVLSNLIENIYDAPENTKLASILTILAMIGVGLIFIFANKLFTNKKFSIDKLTSKSSLIIGLAQALAIFRGTSRSGITLLAGQFVGLDRVSAAEFGFLMSIPVTFVAAAFGTYDIIKTDGANLVNNLPTYLVGLITSFVFGYIAIQFMISYLKKRGLRDFGIYRVVFGVIALILILFI